jgi:hypothetical protein
MARRDKEECGECDFYDPYPCSEECRHYKTFPQWITRCEHRTIEGKRINDAHDPLFMKRELRWCEGWHNGQVVTMHVGFWNEDGPHTVNNIDDEGNIVKR